jgi:long-subunit acyl-CoA synthetase (AMP-forming)
MAGYYGDEASTSKAFRAGGGWFDTGDLGWVAPPGVAGSAMAGCVVLTGRAKDTIVRAGARPLHLRQHRACLCRPLATAAPRRLPLPPVHWLWHQHWLPPAPPQTARPSCPLPLPRPLNPPTSPNLPHPPAQVLSSGKNVEPQPIEDALCSSPLVKHAILLGQDKRELGALLFPDADTLAALAAARGLRGPEELAAPELLALLEAEVALRNRGRAEYWPHEQVAHVAVVVREALSADNGTLTRSLKPRRPEILTRYAAEVAGLMGQLRG